MRWSFFLSLLIQHMVLEEFLYLGSRLFVMLLNQLRKIAGYACARNARNIPPHQRLQRKWLISDHSIHHARVVTHVGIGNPPWREKTLLAFPANAQPAVLRIRKEANGRYRVIDGRDKYMYHAKIWRPVQFIWSWSNQCAWIMLLYIYDNRPNNRPRIKTNDQISRGL